MHSRPATWGRYLMWAEWSYNMSIHSGTQMTPDEVTFGKPPPSIPQYIAGSSSVDAVDKILSNSEEMFASLRKKLLKAQDTMKRFADHNRRDVEFLVADWVFVKLRPRRQVSVTGDSHPKLTKRFFGPFQITQRVGLVAYQLRLPPHSHIHPVFHCSLLHKAFPTTPLSNLSSHISKTSILIFFYQLQYMTLQALSIHIDRKSVV